MTDKKKTALLDKAFKLKFGVKFCLLTIAGFLAITLILHFLLGRNLGGSYAKAIYTIYDLKIKVFPLVFASFYSIFILAIVTIAIIFITVLYSHKIAGPIYRIEKNLEAIGFGDLTVNTRFRGNDQLTGLAEEINHMVRSLNHTVRSCSEALDKVERCEQYLARLIEAGAKDESVKKALEELKESLVALKLAADSIRTKE